MAFLVILVTAAFTGTDNIQALLSDVLLVFVGFPLITFILAVVSYFMIWTPEQAYRWISWSLQDFWTIGKDIWSEKK